MAKYLIKTTEEHRADTELEATELINAAKADGRYILAKYSSVYACNSLYGPYRSIWTKYSIITRITRKVNILSCNLSVIL